jgi:triphosphoribosyl-dephospho-CoA synthase
LAVLLEASANKPGNVNRTADFQSTRYEHFLASAVALSTPFACAAEVGEAVLRNTCQAGDVKLGQIIKDCVVSVNAWQHGGNTLLGTAILLSPIAVAAGMSPDQEGVFEVPTLRRNIKLVVESTTPEDAAKVYEAIRIARPGGLGSSSELDINDPSSISRILSERISLYRIFSMASTYDTICSEWVSNYRITFDVAYPCLKKELEKENLNDAVLHVFLQVLAQHPDTLIARKTSNEKAREISAMAENLLGLGLETLDGKRRLLEFDKKLRKLGNLLNPGTTADIIAAGLAMCVLSGYRP